MTIKKIFLIFTLFYFTSCRLGGNQLDVQNIKTVKEPVVTKKIKAINDEKIAINDVKIKNETIDMLKYHLSLEDDFLGNKNIIKLNNIYKTPVKLKILELNKINILKKHVIKKNNLLKKVKNNKIENLKLKKNNILYLLLTKDYISDSSIYKYVDNKVHYKKLNYLPDNLVKLNGKYIFDAKYNSKVRAITLKNLDLLSQKFYNNFGVKLKIVSAYRSYNYQKGIKDRGCPDLFCAKAGYSEHQSGLAIDFWAATEVNNYKYNKKLKKYFEWMNVNGPKFGFTNSYQKGRKIDGYAIEPWHWRYVGNKLAIYLLKNKITFAEFYYKNIKK